MQQTNRNLGDAQRCILRAFEPNRSGPNQAREREMVRFISFTEFVTQQTQDFCNHLCVVPRPKGLLGLFVTQNVLPDRTYTPLYQKAFCPVGVFGLFYNSRRTSIFTVACFDSQSFQHLTNE